MLLILLDSNRSGIKPGALQDAQRQRWRQRNRGTGFSITELDEQHAAFEARPGTTLVFSMADVPDGYSLSAVTGDITIRLADLGAGRTMSLLAATPGPLHLELDVTVAGQVHIHRTGPDETDIDPDDRLVSLTTDDGCTTDLHLHDARGIVGSALDLDVTLHHSILKCDGHLNTITLDGDNGLDVSGTVTVDTLVVQGETGLYINRPSSFHPKTLEGRTDNAFLKLRTETDREPTLAVRTLAAVRVTSNPSVVLRAAEVTDVALSGAVVLQLEASAVAQRVSGIREGTQTPVLRAGARAVCTELTGEFTLGKVSGAHLEGDTAGFTFAAVESPEPRADSPLKNAVLRSFRVPEGLAGRTLLAELEEVFHLDPNTNGLPGTGSDYKLRTAVMTRDLRGLVLGGAPAGEPSGNLRQNAELVRELRRLAVTKGAPGSTRSTIGWASYRLRHATTVGLPERLALSGYRTLGYGERPGPAVLTWLVLTLLGATVIMGDRTFDPSWDGVARFLREVLDQAAGPLAAVMRSGAPSAVEPFEYILRALIAIPLVTAVIAFRNYVKDGSPS